MFIAVSFAVKDFLVKNLGINSSKIAVVHNGIEANSFRLCSLAKEDKKSEFGFTQSDKIIGTVARIHKQKGHAYLLAAAREVIERFPTAKFLIVGDGPLKNGMEKLSLELGISENVIFTGFYRDIPGILSVLDVFVLPSLWEGLPITILEAMSMKKAVIATRVSGNPEVIEDNVTGILVPSKDSHSLAQAIIRLVENEDARLKMGEAGYNRVSRLFSVKKMVEETAAIYERLIKEKNVEVN
jgi:glycosyltransferase involved in cell wall biosynthesis